MKPLSYEPEGGQDPGAGGAENPIVCPLCGTRYSESAARTCQDACPLADGCQLLRCPRCGYEVPAPTRLTRWLSRWLGSSRARKR